MAEGARRVLVSAASSWELAIKHQRGKLPLASEIVETLQLVSCDAMFQRYLVDVFW